MSHRVALASAAAALALAASLVVPPARAAGPELLPNGDFETGTNPSPVIAVPGVGTYDQPLLPVGWTFEGAAGLFDHSAYEHHHGRYSAGISVPASGGTHVCQQPHPSVPQTCADYTPLNLAKGAADGAAYSVTPAWRPQDPVSVTGGVVYEIAGWYSWQVATEGVSGAIVKVRWLDANGVGIRTDTVFADYATPANKDVKNWTQFIRLIGAPPAAVKAVPLFGALDDVNITKVSYDQVSFHAA